MNTVAPSSHPSEDSEEQCLPNSSRLSSTSKWITVLLAQCNWDVLSDCGNRAINKILSAMFERVHSNSSCVIRKNIWFILFWKVKKARPFLLVRVEWLKLWAFEETWNCVFKAFKKTLYHVMYYILYIMFTTYTCRYILCLTVYHVLQGHWEIIDIQTRRNSERELH